MSLLTPAFLAGLGLLAVPILIHLTHRQRSRVTPFPSLMFLRRVPFKTRDRRRIRHPLLFALRCLALALLALAFARPFLPGGDAGGGAGSSDVVLLIDASGSLSYGDRWERALNEATAALAGLVPGDRAAVVSFAEAATEELPLTGDLELADRTVRGLEPSGLGTRLEAGLQLAGRILAESEREERAVVLISDFQRSGWRDEGRARLPDGVELRPISLAEEGAGNAAVVDARITAGTGDRVRISARVTNLSDAALEGVPVALELGGRVHGTLTVDMAPRAAGIVAFEDVPLPAGPTRGRLMIPGDRLAADDELRFVAAPDPGLEVLVLEEARGRPDRSLFLERALRVSEAPRVPVIRRPAASFDASWLSSAALVIVNDARLASSAARSLAAWLEGGGALLVALGPDAGPSRWEGPPGELLGGRVGEVEDRTDRSGARLAWLDYDHPVFEPFSAPRSGDFSEARFFRFRAFEPADSSRVLARFEGGEPALVEGSRGAGRVLVWMSTLDRFWNDLALQPVFVPFVHRAVLHATRYRVPERWASAGDVIRLESLLGEEPGAGGERVLVTPDGDRRPVEREADGTWIRLDEVGFYRVEPLEAAGEGVSVAVNPPLSESDLTPVAPERVAQAVVGAAGATAGEGRGGEAGPEPARRELWWPLLLLAGVALAAESLIANRWMRPRAARAAGSRAG